LTASESGTQNTKHLAGQRSKQSQLTVETEVVRAAFMRSLVRQAVESYLPPNALEIARIAEDEERRGMRLVADAMEKGLTQRLLRKAAQ
jgi:hypothetical protein